MADKKISALTGASTPLDGTEVLPIVQSGATVKVANNDLRPKQIQSNATSGVLQVVGPAAASTRVMTTPNANFTVARIDASQTFLASQSFSAANGTTPIVSTNNTTTGNAAGFQSSLQAEANNTSSYHFFGSTFTIGNWYLYGNGTSSWSSDERLKRNIVTTRDGYIDDVCKLRVVKYQWKNGPDQVELGLIAQEVEQIFPGLVQDDLNQISPDDPILYKQLKGSVLPFILIKAIQEQQTIINALKARLDAANL